MSWLAAWGIIEAASVFQSIMEEVAGDVAKDASKSYIKSCFKRLWSPLTREPLTKATGKALVELLELIEGGLVGAGVADEELPEYVDGVRRLIKTDGVALAIGSLFEEPSYQLDPAVFANAWQSLDDVRSLPAHPEFSWERIAKQFARKVAALRRESAEVQRVFEAKMAEKSFADQQARSGQTAEFNLNDYREALLERFERLKLDNLDKTGAYYSRIVKLWNVFVPQSARMIQHHPRLLEFRKEDARRIDKRDSAVQEDDDYERKLRDQLRREVFNQPTRPVLDICGDEKTRHVVILGDPGSSKSSLLRYLALCWTQAQGANLR